MAHMGEKPYPCNVCNQSCKLKVHTKRHMKIHIGEKPYSENKCNKRYYGMSNIGHMRSHPGEKPFSCKQSNKRKFL